MALANALRAHGDVAAALAAFERERMPANRRIMQRGRELGGYLAAASAERRRRWLRPSVITRRRR